MIKELFYFLIFPGLVFSSIIGGFLAWFDRKITARVQFRQGPPLLQPFYDFVKLLAKETILPKNGSKLMFLLAPIIGLFGATISNIFILLPLFGFETGFRGDLIVIFYLLSVPSISYIIGAMASGNPLAAIGASREMKLILSYELTFLLALIGIIIKTDMSLSLYEIINMQSTNGAHIGSVSGVLLFIALIFCFQAKLGLVPFDMAEAETEISHGLFIEYSGTAYAIFKLTKYVMLFTLPALAIALLMGGFQLTGIGIIWSIGKVLVIVLLFTLIRNTNPRVRIREAMKFFFIWLNLLVIFAVLLSMYGL